MRKIISYSIILLAVVIITSCRNKGSNIDVAYLKSIVDSTLGKKLIIPDSLRIYKPVSKYTADSVSISKADLKIYSCINTSCGSCIAGINLWKNISAQISKHNIPIILICESDDEFELLRYFCKSN